MSNKKSEKQAKTGLRFVLGFIVYSMTFLVLAAGAAFWWGAQNFHADGPLTEEINIVVKRGSGLNTIATQLDDIGAISNRYVFIIGTRALNAQGGLQAGEYALTPSISARDIVNLLRDGDTVKRRFTIREGLTSFEIVRILNAVEGLSGDIDAVPREGALLPNTYDYQLGEPRVDVIARMSDDMHKTLDTLWDKRADDLPFKTKAEAMTLASIIEKETAVAEERGKVAGVFVNRLRRGMPLQTDPTVIYAITKGKHKNDGKGPLGRRLLRKDLQYDSPYNTYKYAGLPPGPIANPGRASIEAALNPESHDYIFFVANGTGGHAFAKTLSGHNRNVAKWRKIRAKQ